jgi:hypothetical protein
MNMIEKIPDYAHLMPISEWRDSVAGGLFVPDDGIGRWATGDTMDDSSDVWAGDAPEWATHVAWFNK